MSYDDEDMMGEELSTVGEDDMEDIVGAAVKLALNKKGLTSAMRRPGAIKKPSWMGRFTGQGVSTTQEALDYLPMTTKVLTLAASSGFCEGFPQRPFRGERIVANATLTDTAAPGVFTNALGFVAISPSITVGATQVGAAQGDAPLAVWAGDSFGVRLSWPTAGQGTRVYIPIRALVTLSATQSITVNFTITGKCVR